MEHLRPFLFVAFVAACSTPALAISESCPAQIQFVTPVGAIGRPATSYVYDLEAISARTVDATIVADTSGGWYTWDVSGIPLVDTTRDTYVHDTYRSYRQHLEYRAAASSPLGVTFPAAVALRHAWVVNAKSTGETVMGWDAQGLHQCGVPAFSPESVTETQGYSGPQRAVPTPLPSPTQLTKAMPTSAPFPIKTCTTPFAPVTIIKAENPRYPAGLLTAVNALIDVMVDAQGKVVDASARATSGYKDADINAAQAAAASTYQPAASYCQPVEGHYFFRADFNPG